MKEAHQDQDFVLHALSVAPAHLFPAASNGERLAIGSDKLGLDGECKYTLGHSSCPGQKQQVQPLIDAARKALQPTPLEGALSPFWAAILLVQQTLALPLLMLLTHLRWLNLTRSLKQIWKK